MRHRLFCVRCGDQRYTPGDLWCAPCCADEEFIARAEQTMRERLIVAPETLPLQAAADKDNDR